MKTETKGVWEYLKIVTPVMVTIGLFMIANLGAGLNSRICSLGTELNAKIDKIDNRMFTHFTNDELHVPRSTIVTEGEFNLVSKMRELQIADIKRGIGEIKHCIAAQGMRMDQLIDEVKDAKTGR